MNVGKLTDQDFITVCSNDNANNIPNTDCIMSKLLNFHRYTNFEEARKNYASWKMCHLISVGAFFYLKEQLSVIDKIKYSLMIIAQMKSGQTCT